MKLKGAEIVLECLIKEGVDLIFGYPGGAVLPLYDALYNYKKYFKHITTAHEQGAVHGADGYARSTGKVGVCFATSGPGATNTITGIATSYMDSVPLVVITGQVTTPLLGKDSFQEIDITGITVSITKHNYSVENIEELADTIREAFFIAKEGRPGPVLIDIPKDILMEEFPFQSKSSTSTGQEQQQNIDKTSLIKITDEINNSSRPIIYAGGGVIHSNASEKLLEFAEISDIPVVNTLMGLGSFPREHKLSLGLVGMHGFREANLAVTHSDLIIAIGARFSDRVVGNANEFASNARIIHIDIDKTEIGKNKAVNYSLIGDVKYLLKELINYINKNDRKDWHKEIQAWCCKEDADGGFIAKNIIEAINHSFEDKVIVVTDVGQHQMWTAQYWKFKAPRTFISSGGLGTMGYGLGAAIGCQLSNPTKRIIHITGDGCFRMNCNELATVSRYNVPITTIIFNNNSLGMVRQWQKLFTGERYSETDLGNEVDYTMLGNAYGIKGYKVDSIDDLKSCLHSIRDNKSPIIIECLINKNDCVLPIVPPGKPIDSLILKIN